MPLPLTHPELPRIAVCRGANAAALNIRIGETFWIRVDGVAIRRRFASFLLALVLIGDLLPAPLLALAQEISAEGEVAEEAVPAHEAAEPLDRIAGTVFADRNGNGAREENNEEGIQGVSVQLTRDGETLLLQTDEQGRYTFEGTSLTAETLSETEDAAALLLLDGDKDRDSDLFVGNASSLPNRLYRNIEGKLENAGVMLEEHPDGPFSSTRAMALLDTTGGGLEDVIVAGAEGIELYENQGGGTFTLRKGAFLMPPEAGRATGATVPLARTLAVFDADGDKRKDIFVGRGFGLPNVLFRNEGKGAFAYAGEWMNGGIAGTTPGATNAVLLFDLDGDKDEDVILGNEGRNEVYVQEDSKNVSCRVASRVSSLDTRDDTAGCIEAPDSSTSFRFAGYRFNGSTEPVLEHEKVSGTLGEKVPDTFSPGVTHAIAAFDADRDGDEDLIFGKDGGSEFYRNEEGGVFTLVENIFEETKDSSIHSITIFDADGDSDSDLFLGSAVSTSALYLNDSLDGAIKFRRLAMESHAESSLSADLDGDGDLDLVMGGGAGDQSALYRNRTGAYSLTLDETTLPVGYGARPGTAALEGTLTVGSIREGQDIALLPEALLHAGSIEGRVYLDRNADGKDDPGEKGVSGIAVSLSGTFGAGEAYGAEAATDAGGRYLFERVPVSSAPYVLRVHAAALPFSHLPTTALEQTALLETDDEEAAAAGFGFEDLAETLGAGTMRGNVSILPLDDGEGPQGIAGAKVTVSGSTKLTTGSSFSLGQGAARSLVFETITGSDGTFVFSSVPLLAYELSVDASSVPEGLIPAGSLTQTVVLAEEGETQEITFDFSRKASVIAARVFREGTQAPLAGVSLALLEEGRVLSEKRTGLDGSARFFVRTGSFAVTISGASLPPGYEVSSPATQDASVSATGEHKNVSFAASWNEECGTGLCVLGTVWHDGDGDGAREEGEEGIPGVSVEMRGTEKVSGTFSTTNASGSYVLTTSAFKEVPSTFESISDAGPVSAIGVIDVNNDDLQDLIVGKYGERNEVFLQENSKNVSCRVASRVSSLDTRDDTAGCIEASESFSFRSLGARFNDGFLGSDARYTTSIETFDIDGDGDDDVLIGNDGQPNELYRNLGNGTFELLEEDFTPDAMPEGVGRHTAGFLIANLSGDTHDDVLVLNTLKSPNELYEGRGDGTFRFVGELFNGGLSSEHRSSVAAVTLDSDADGAFDHIVIGNDLSEPNELYELNAAGEIRYLGDTFNGGIADAKDRSTVDLAALDVDRDGDDDLLVGNSDGPNELYANHGNGNFTYVGEHFNDHRDGGTRTKDFVLFDADADGDEDVLVLSEDAPVALYRNEANGSFTWVGNVFEDSPSLLLPIDLDRDGKRELVLGYGNAPHPRPLPSGEGNARCCAVMEPSRKNADEMMIVGLDHGQLTSSAQFTTPVSYPLLTTNYLLFNGIDFGLTTETSRIEGTVFLDGNGNGMREKQVESGEEERGASTRASVSSRVVPSSSRDVSRDNTGAAQHDVKYSPERAIAGALLTLEGVSMFGKGITRETVTDALGRYSFENVPPARGEGYVLRAEAPHPHPLFATTPAYRTIPLLTGGLVIARDFSFAEGVTVEGRVREKVSGTLGDKVPDTFSPLPGVSLLLEGATITGDPLSRTVRADAEGQFVFDSLPFPRGTYTLRIVLDSVSEDLSAVAETSVSLEAHQGGETIEQSFSFVRASRIEGRARMDVVEKVPGTLGDKVPDTSGVNPGITLILSGSTVTGEKVNRALTTDTIFGTYAFIRLLPGEYAIAIDPASVPEGYHVVAEKVPGTLGEKVPGTFQVPDTFPMRITLGSGVSERRNLMVVPATEEAEDSEDAEETDEQEAEKTVDTIEQPSPAAEGVLTTATGSEVVPSSLEVSAIEAAAFSQSTHPTFTFEIPEGVTDLAEFSKHLKVVLRDSAGNTIEPEYLLEIAPLDVIPDSVLPTLTGAVVPAAPVSMIDDRPREHEDRDIQVEQHVGDVSIHEIHREKAMDSIQQPSDRSNPIAPKNGGIDPMKNGRTKLPSATWPISAKMSESLQSWGWLSRIADHFITLFSLLQSGRVHAQGSEVSEVTSPPLQTSHTSQTSLVITIVPPADFAPGSYNIEVLWEEVESPTTSRGKRTTTLFQSEFSWGVFAFNPDQDRYFAGDAADLAFGVLDDAGEMVCGAEIDVVVKPPSAFSSSERSSAERIEKPVPGEVNGPLDSPLDTAQGSLEENTQMLSTRDGSIAVSPTCAVKQAGLIAPDYSAQLRLPEPGTYKLAITVETPNGVREYEEEIVVIKKVSGTLGEKVPDTFSDTILVHRTGATRLWPLAPSPMTITVSFFEDYTGPVTEYVPASFVITKAEPARKKASGKVSGTLGEKVPDTFPSPDAFSVPTIDRQTLNDREVIAITWEGSWKVGESAVFAYEYDAPDTSPDFFLLGPLKLGAAEQSDHPAVMEVLEGAKEHAFSSSERPVGASREGDGTDQLLDSSPVAPAPGSSLEENKSTHQILLMEKEKDEATGEETFVPRIIEEAGGAGSPADVPAQAFPPAMEEAPVMHGQDAHATPAGTSLMPVSPVAKNEQDNDDREGSKNTHQGAGDVDERQEFSGVHALREESSIASIATATAATNVPEKNWSNNKNGSRNETKAATISTAAKSVHSDASTRKRGPAGNSADLGLVKSMVAHATAFFSSSQATKAHARCTASTVPMFSFVDHIRKVRNRKTNAQKGECQIHEDHGVEEFHDAGSEESTKVHVFSLMPVLVDSVSDEGKEERNERQRPCNVCQTEDIGDAHDCCSISSSAKNAKHTKRIPRTHASVKRTNREMLANAVAKNAIAALEQSAEMTRSRGLAKTHWSIAANLTALFPPLQAPKAHAADDAQVSGVRYQVSESGQKSKVKGQQFAAVELRQWQIANDVGEPVRTWDGGGGPSDINWSTASNWSGDSVPTSNEIVVFNGAAGKTNSTVNSSFAGKVHELRVGTAFTGTITLARTLTVSGALVLSGGTLDVSASNYDLTVKGDWIQRGSGAFNARSGTVILSGTGSAGHAIGTNTLSGSSTFYNLTLDNGLVGYWRLDDGTGATIARDSSRNGNNGSFSGGPIWVASPSHTSRFFNPYALSFDGVDDLVSVSHNNNLNLVNGFSASFWVYQRANEFGGFVVKDYYAWGAWSIGTSVRFQTRDVVQGGSDMDSTANSLPVNAWTHVVCTYNVASKKIYINGALNASRDVSGVMANTTTALNIGEIAGLGGFPFDGLLDDVRIYNRALTLGEIQSLNNGYQSTGSGVYVLGAALNVSGNLRIDSGTLDASASNFATTLSGAWINHGDFTPRSGTVTLDGGTAVQTLSGNTVFNNLTRTVTSAATTFFDFTARQSVSGALTLRGSAAIQSLRSTKTGSASNLLLDGSAGTQSLNLLDVRDSDASGGSALTCTTGCVNTANNTNWTFGTQKVWDGGGSDTNWSTAGNWTGDTVPTSNDIAIFDGTGKKNAIVNPSFAGIVAGLRITAAHTGSLTLNRNLTVSGAVALSGGTLTFSDQGRTMTVKGNWDQRPGNTFTAGTGTVILSGTGSSGHWNGTNTLSGSATFNNLTIDNGLVGYWRLDDGTGATIARDSSRNGNNGTFSGGPVWVASPSHTSRFFNPYALKFDGTDDHVLSANNVGLSGDLTATMSAWVYVTGTKSLQSIVAFGGSVAVSVFSLFLNIDGADTGVLSSEYNSGNSVRTAAGTISKNQWYHVALTKTAGNINSTTKIYVNGVEQSVSGGPASAPNITNSQVYIGKYTDSEHRFQGNIDDVRIYNRALTLGEIQSLNNGYQSTGSGVYILGSALNIAGNVRIDAGTLDASSSNYAVTLSGAFMNHGDFTPRSGTVTLDGGTAVQTLSGNTVFNNLTRTVTSAATTFFDFTARQSVSGALTLRGNTAIHSLRSTKTGSASNLLLDGSAGTQSLQLLDVRDSDASGGATLTCATGCTNTANNTNWTFGTQKVWDGGGSGTNWSTAGNWTGDTVPGSNDIAVFNGTGKKNAVIDPSFAGIVAGLRITAAHTGSLTLNRNLTVSGAVALSGGTLTFSDQGRTMTVKGNWDQRPGNTFTAGTGTVILSGTGSAGHPNGTNTLSGSSTFYNLTLDNGLVGYWRLDDGSGSTVARDSSRNANHGTLTNYTGVQTSTGWVNTTHASRFFNPSVLEFDGTNDYVSMGTPAALNITGPITVTFWINPISTETNETIFAKDGNSSGVFSQYFADFRGTTGRWQFVITDGTTDNSSGEVALENAFTNGEWAHGVALWDGSNIRLYKNGSQILIAATTISAIRSNANGKFGIGADVQNNRFFIDSLLDDVRIYNRALSASEVSALYQGNPSTGSGVYILGSALNIAGNVRIDAGTLDASSSNYAVTLSGAFMNHGDFTPRSGTVTLDGGTAVQTLSGNTVFNNLTRTVTSAATTFFDFTARQSVSGALTLRGAASNLLSIRSSKTGSAANLLLDGSAGTQSLQYLNVRDSDASGGAELLGTLASVNSGNNTNWAFGDRIAGKVYSDAGFTPLTSVTVAASLNGGAATRTDAVDSGGEYTITGLAMTGGTIVTLFIDGASQDAVTVTLGSGSNMTGVSLYQNRLIVRSDSGSVSLANSHLRVADNSADADITAIYGMRDGDTAAVLTDGKELYIWSGDTFAPAGRVEAENLHMEGSYTQGNNLLTLSGALTQSGGTFTGGAAVVAIGNGLTIDAGTFTAPSTTLTLSGAFTQTAGTFTHNGGTVSLRSMIPTTTTIVGNFNNLRVETPTESGLVGYWKMDSGTGAKAFDASGRQNDGTLTNMGSRSWTGATTSSIRFSNPYALSFDGTDDYVNAATDILNSANSFTLSAWIKLSSNFAGDDGIVGEWVGNAGAMLHGRLASGQSKLNFQIAGDTLVANTVFALNTWYHVAGTFDGATATVYINGAQDIQAARSGSNASTPFEIGSYSDNAGGNFPGLLDDVRIYNRTLTASEINNLAMGGYAAGTGSTTVTAGSPLSLSGTLSIDAGTFNANAKRITLAEQFAMQKGNGIYRSSTATGSFRRGFTMSGGVFAGNSGGVDIERGFTMSGGTFTAPYAAMTISGSYIQTAGTFRSGTGTVRLDGINRSMTLNAEDSFNNLQLDNGLVGYWRLDDGTGATIARDSSRNGNNGTFSGGPIWVSSPSHTSRFFNPYALKFDGTDDYVTIANESNFDQTDYLTVAGWIKMNDSGRNPLAGKSPDGGGSSGGWYFDYGGFNAGQVEFGALGAEITYIFAGSSMSTGVWHHIAGVFNKDVPGNGKVKIYIDGSEPSITYTAVGSLSTILPNNAAVLIARGSESSANYTNADIDDVRIYNRALTLGEIQSLNNGYQSTGSGVYVLGSALNVAGNLRIDSGTLDASSSNYAVTLSGSWIGNGDFTQRSGTVTLDGGTAAQTLSGNTVFNNLTRTVTSAATTFFDFTARQSVSGALTLRGAVGSLQKIRSTKTGSASNLMLDGNAGTQSIDYLDVQDSDASNGAELVCYASSEGCTDAGRNINWNFTDPSSGSDGHHKPSAFPGGGKKPTSEFTPSKPALSDAEGSRGGPGEEGAGESGEPPVAWAPLEEQPSLAADIPGPREDEDGIHVPMRVLSSLDRERLARERRLVRGAEREPTPLAFGELRGPGILKGFRRLKRLALDKLWEGMRTVIPPETVRRIQPPERAVEPPKTVAARMRVWIFSLLKDIPFGPLKLMSQASEKLARSLAALPAMKRGDRLIAGIGRDLRSLMGAERKHFTAPASERYYTTRLRQGEAQELILETFRIAIVGPRGPYAFIPVTLSSEPQDMVTDRDGIAIFQNVETGKHELTIHLGKNEALEKEVTLEAPEGLEVAEDAPVEVIIPLVEVRVSDPPAFALGATAGKHGAAPPQLRRELFTRAVIIITLASALIVQSCLLVLVLRRKRKGQG